MNRIRYNNLFAKISVAVVLATVAYVVCFSPAVTHAQTSAFAGAEIVILNQNTPFHFEPGNEAVRFVVAEGTLAEVLYFADPEVRNGQIWRKLRVADGYYGYVRESLISKYTGTIPTIWREIDYQASKVHLNYEARKGNYNIVINQGVEYVNSNSDSISSNDTNVGQPTEDNDTTEDEDTLEGTNDEFNGKDIVVAPRNLTFYQSAGGARAFTVARGTIAEILEFSTPQTINGRIWHKLRVADGHWGYVTEDSIEHYTGTVPTIWREIDYQASKVHLNYEARKGNHNVVIDQGVVYINPNDDTLPDNNTTTTNNIVEEDKTGEVVEAAEAVEISEENKALMLQIIALLKQLINLRMQLMQL